MKLDELHIDDKAIIINIDADKTLKDRLSSFGIVRNEEVTVKSLSLANQTIEIDVDGTLIALRATEAHKIEVKKI
jgi:ferrous iron transport protein A